MDRIDVAVFGIFSTMTIHPFHPRNDHHRSATTWEMLLHSATSVGEVVATARDFMASFTPHEVDLLPQECRPRKLLDADDIAQYSYDLTVHRWDDESAGSAVIQAFARFFADASERIAQIAGAAQKGERESA